MRRVAHPMPSRQRITPPGSLPDFRRSCKLSQKRYHRFTGYIGNFRSSSATEVLSKKPEKIIMEAVRRMLPTGALGRKSLRKLKVYAGVEHPHGAQKPREHKLTG